MSRLVALAVVVVAVLVAACGTDTSDLLIVERTGKLPDAKLTLLITDGLIVECNGVKKDLPNDLLLDARDLGADAVTFGLHFREAFVGFAVLGAAQLDLRFGLTLVGDEGFQLRLVLRERFAQRGEFDIVAAEIAATLYHVGAPRQEHGEFMAIIESYRAMVVGPPGDKVEQTGAAAHDADRQPALA